MNYLTVPLSNIHNRESFKSGTDLLDRYFRHQSKQDVKRKLSACFVYANEEGRKIIGFYTLSSTSISQELIPHHYRKRFPGSYTQIPMILLGRIAVDIDYQGQGVGRLLLVDALKRCDETSRSIGSYAVVVDPIDLAAAKFYERFGFIELPSSGKMFLPIKTIQNLFK